MTDEGRKDWQDVRPYVRGILAFAMFLRAPTFPADLVYSFKVADQFLAKFEEGL